VPRTGIGLVFSGILMLRVLPCFAERCRFQRENSRTLDEDLLHILLVRSLFKKEKRDQRSAVAVLAE